MQQKVDEKRIITGFCGQILLANLLAVMLHKMSFRIYNILCTVVGLLKAVSGATISAQKAKGGMIMPGKVKKMGRPKKKSRLAKTISVNTRMSPGEKSRLDKLCEIADLNQSEVMRYALAELWKRRDERMKYYSP